MHPSSTAHLHFHPFPDSDATDLFALDSDLAVHRYLGGMSGRLVTEFSQSRATVHFIQTQYAANGTGCVRYKADNPSQKLPQQTFSSV